MGKYLTREELGREYLSKGIIYFNWEETSNSEGMKTWIDEIDETDPYGDTLDPDGERQGEDGEKSLAVHAAWVRELQAKLGFTHVLQDGYDIYDLLPAARGSGSTPMSTPATACRPTTIP